MSESKPARKAARRRKQAPLQTVQQAESAQSATAGSTDGHENRTLIRFPIDVRWRDLDAFNHVNNANFLTYLEEARLAWMQALPGPWVTERSAPVLAAVQLSFRRPIAWPESLVVVLYPRRVGASSLTLAFRMTAAHDDDILYSDGETVMVWVDAESGKAASIPEAVRQGSALPNVK